MARLNHRPGTAASSRRRGILAVGCRHLLIGLLWFTAGSFLLAGPAAAYTVKRALHIDVVPGIDMLPDERIEGAIRAVLGLIASGSGLPSRPRGG